MNSTTGIDLSNIKLNKKKKSILKKMQQIVSLNMM